MTSVSSTAAGKQPHCDEGRPGVGQGGTCSCPAESLWGEAGVSLSLDRPGAPVTPPL